MNKFWIGLVVISLILVVALIGWDAFLYLIGAKNPVHDNIPAIGNTLFENVEEHLRSDPYFYLFEEAAEEDDTTTTTIN